jgi:hypothetical protein
VTIEKTFENYYRWAVLPFPMQQKIKSPGGRPCG